MNDNSDSNLPKRPHHEDAGPGVRVNLMRAFTKKGIASRSQAREWIMQGRVKVNGRVEKFVYAWIDLQQDVIALDDQPLDSLAQKLYILFHKPVGYLTARVDQNDRPTIYDLLPAFATWVFPVGRLDMDSEGLLILTNDGPFGEKLSHPDSHVAKTYRVLIDRPLQEPDRERLEKGIDLGGYITRPAQVQVLAPEKNAFWIEMVIHEGKNRQVRRMLKAVDYRVLRLLRTHIGKVALADLPAGQWRYMTREELADLQTTIKTA
jgi:23S rRNA pseudouridine2605 synthase